MKHFLCFLEWAKSSAGSRNGVQFTGENLTIWNLGTQLPEYQHPFPSIGLWPKRALGSRMLIQQVSKNASCPPKTRSFTHEGEEP